MTWRETLLLDVPMRGAAVVERTERIERDDARFVDGVLTVTDRGRYLRLLQRQHAPHRPTDRAVHGTALRASGTIAQAGRHFATRWLLAETVVDTDETPLGILGWDDLVRFALARGLDDPWSVRPAGDATRPDHAITPNARSSRLGAVETVADVARAMIAGRMDLGGMNDALQRSIVGGIVTPGDLLRAIFT